VVVVVVVAELVLRSGPATTMTSAVPTEVTGTALV
jgi:hypothetical protein